MPYHMITSQEALDRFVSECRNANPSGAMYYAQIETADPLFVEDAPSNFGLYKSDRRRTTPGIVDVHGGQVYLYDHDLTVRAYGSTRVRLEQGTVRAYEHTEINVEGGGKIVASPHVVIRTTRHTYADITGGIVIPDIRWQHNWGIPTEDWLALYDLEPDEHGVVVVYKAVNRYYESGQGYTYEPGSTPDAHDWRTSVQCGGGLHFSPTPYLTRRYAGDADRLLGCPVRVDEIVTHGDKIKARRVVEPGCFRVDIYGRRLDEDGRLIPA